MASDGICKRKNKKGLSNTILLISRLDFVEDLPPENNHKYYNMKFMLCIIQNFTKTFWGFYIAIMLLREEPELLMNVCHIGDSNNNNCFGHILVYKVKIL